MAEYNIVRQFAKRQNHTVISTSIRSGDADFPSNYLFEFLEWFVDAKEAIPPEYQERSRCYLEVDGDEVKITIVYDRPETDEEMDARVLHDRQQILAKEEAELKLLERLEQKYRWKK